MGPATPGPNPERGLPAETEARPGADLTLVWRESGRAKKFVQHRILHLHEELPEAHPRACRPRSVEPHGWH